MEHFRERQWEYRWRITGPVPPAYAVWRYATEAGSHAIIASEKRDAPIQVEWRWAGESAWRQAALHRLLAGECRFRFRCHEAFAASEAFTVVAPVRGVGVAAYRFEPVVIAAGGEAVLVGRADCGAWPNVLLAEGEFAAAIPGMEVVNIGASSGSWQAVAFDGDPVLSVCPVAAARRWFAFGGSGNLVSTPSS